MPISLMKAPLVKSCSVAICALRPKRPMRPSGKRLGRPEMPSPLRSSGSAAARISDSGTASSSPNPNTLGVVRRAIAVASGGTGSFSIPRDCASAGVMLSWITGPPMRPRSSHTPT